MSPNDARVAACSVPGNKCDRRASLPAAGSYLGVQCLMSGQQVHEYKMWVVAFFLVVVLFFMFARFPLLGGKLCVGWAGLSLRTQIFFVLVKDRP